MAKSKGLSKQVSEVLIGKMAAGDSKYQDKRINNGKPDREKIYSYCTLRGYLRSCIQFTKWCKQQNQKCKTLEDCVPFITDYLTARAATVAASTVHRDAAAIAKLYGWSMADLGVELPRRERKDFTKNRGDKWVGHYSRESHPDITLLSAGTGLRRHEMERLRPDQVVKMDDGSVVIKGIRGKGGKLRDIPVLPQYADEICQLAQYAAEMGRDRVLLGTIPKYAPIHADRGQIYARGLYDIYARPIEEIADPRERYYARKDMQGQVFDRLALEIVSQALGHSRVGVVMNYLR